MKHTKLITDTYVPPLKCTSTAVHHGWGVLTSVSGGNYNGPPTAGSTDVRFPVYVAEPTWAVTVLRTQGAYGRL